MCCPFSVWPAQVNLSDCVGVYGWNRDGCLESIWNIQMFPQCPRHSGESWVVCDYQWNLLGGLHDFVVGVTVMSPYGGSASPSLAVCLHRFLSIACSGSSVPLLVT